MKIALCFYGQPRNFIKSFPDIKKHILDKYDTDVFFHCWYDINNSTQNYDVSPWRYSSKTLNCSVSLDVLKKIYSPKSFICEPPQSFDISEYKDTLGYQKSRIHIKNNFPNILSQSYSRYKVKCILNEYVDETDTKYDFVIGTRFDFKLDEFPELSTLDKDYIYFTDHHSHRPYVFNDNISISSLENFYHIFDIYKNITELANGQFEMVSLTKDSDYYTLINGVELNIESLNTGNLMYHKIFHKAKKISSLKMDLYK